MLDQVETVRSNLERNSFERDLINLRPQLIRYTKSLTGTVHAAEDLAQDALLRALKNYQSFQPGTNLRAWLFTIARNFFFSERRRDKWHAELDPDVAAKTLTTDLQVFAADASIDFHRLLICMTLLPQSQSDALVAVGYLGLSYEDAALRLGCAIGTIKSRVARGRTALEAWFEDGGKLPDVDTIWLRTVSHGVPQDHPMYVIVKAYEELYSEFCSTPDKSAPKPEDEQAWLDLVASGALDVQAEDLDGMMRCD